jgi:hypothetical protein
MARFFQVGLHWINLDQVLSVELVMSHKDPEKLVAVKVRYNNGPPQEFNRAEEMEGLKRFLESHQA